MADFRPVGRAANDAEREGFRLLRDHLPDHYVILGNFELHLPRRRNSLEYDAVVIGEYGFYAVEIKGWSGDIKAGDRNWQVPWGKVSNPLCHLQKKTKALSHYIRQKVSGLPGDCLFAPALFFPRGDVRLECSREVLKYVVDPERVYDFFVDLEMVHEKGPGPLRCRERIEEVIEAIVELASPSTSVVQLPYYEVEGELDSTGKPYREFVGSHQYLKSRSKVRIKSYSLDALAPGHQLQEEQSRLLRDMEALDAMKNLPYVARSYEMQPDYDDEMNFYVVSEWVGPQTLKAYLKEKPEASREERENLGRHLVAAVATIHETGTIHRNLNPESIYLTGNERGTPLKIADFDFARVAQLESISEMLSVLGTDGYRAPELWLDGDYDEGIDLFSLGAILFELFTGTRYLIAAGDLLRLEETWARRKGELEEEWAEWIEVIRGLVSENPEERGKAMKRARELRPKEMGREKG